MMAGRVEAGRTKFPTCAVVILALAMTIQDYALVSLFPYVGTMVKGLLSLETTNEAGFYAGYVASAYTFGRFLSSYVWGHVTDSAGRKAVIVIALISIVTFSLAFGFSTSYTWAITSRLLLGLTNGITPALRTTLCEICGPEHVVVGMTYLSSCKSISMVFGTGIGGILAEPAVRFPSSFSATGIFGRYPHLLPNLVGACGALLVLALVVVFLPETKDYAENAASPKPVIALQPLASDGGDNFSDTTATDSDTPREADHSTGSPPALNNYQQLTTTPANAGDNGTPVGGDGLREDELLAIRDSRTKEDHREEGVEEEPGIFGRKGLLAVRHVKVLLFLACVTQGLQIGFEEVYPLFALSTTDVGGLGWEPFEIGQVLVATGFLMAVVQLILFPPFIKVVGIATGQRLGFVIGIPAFIAISNVKTLSWNCPSLVSVSVGANTLVNCSLFAVNLALTIGSTTLVPSSMRGKLGGLFSMTESLGRFLGPAGYAVSYAWSISPSGIQDHNFVFFVSAAMLALCAVLAWPTLTAENLMKKDNNEERDERVAVRDGGDWSGGAGGVQGACADFDLCFISTPDVAHRETDMV